MHVSQLKDVCRRELDRSEVESVRNQALTSEYKQVVCFGCLAVLVSQSSCDCHCWMVVSETDTPELPKPPIYCVACVL